MAGYFNNLLANVISFNNIYTSIQENQDAGNDAEVIYNVGRLLRIMLIFDPIEQVDDLHNTNVDLNDEAVRFRGKSNSKFDKSNYQFNEPNEDRKS